MTYLHKPGPNPNSPAFYNDLFSAGLAKYEDSDRLTWWRDLASILKPHLDGKHHLLDAGCGTGAFLAALPTELRKTGVDYSSKALDAAKAKAVPNCELVQADLEGHLPFVEDKFDFGTMTEVLEHLSHPKDVVMELMRVVSGTIAITVPHGDGGHDRYSYHVNTFTSETLVEFAEACGLKTLLCVRGLLPKSKTILLLAETSLEKEGINLP